MITVKNLIFEYPGKRALQDVSFNIKAGSITALVGPNGSGKTTLLRCIAALDTPFAGNIEINGIDALEHPRQIHRQIGYLSDFFGVYKDLTVRQCLTFNASIHQIPEMQIPQKVEFAASRLDITNYLDVNAGSLSRGLRQRLGIAQAIIHEPKILLLDEPASGLDPEARISLSNLFIALQKQGMTLVVSSHILAELEDYCTDMLLLRDGKIIEHYNAEKHAQIDGLGAIEITLYGNADKYLEIIRKIEGISNATASENIIQCNYSVVPGDLIKLLKILIEKEMPVLKFAPQEKRLQDIYMDSAHGEINAKN